ncbi:MAG: hypothetical protein IJY04_08040 [Clostridia bacterium]|nr:hypothetical protein [Clostridia bacterium]
MKIRKIQQSADDIVCGEISSGGMMKGNAILKLLPELLATVYVDRETMREALERCLSTQNPINAILKLFGLQIIRREKTFALILETEQKNGCGPVSDKDFGVDWLRVDGEALGEKIEVISEILREQEKAARQVSEEEKNARVTLLEKLYRIEKKYNELKHDSDIKDLLIAQRVHYLLSLFGRDNGAYTEQLVELLKELDIEVYWECDGAPFTDAAMFAVYNTDDEGMLGVKPCLVKDGAVYVKGIRVEKSCS